jgi:hypothetical protein
VIVRYGRTCPIDEGFLPVFSVDTEQEARTLLTMACPTNMNGEFVARELVQEQTLENLEAFGDKLEKYYEVMKKRKKEDSK